MALHKSFSNRLINRIILIVFTVFIIMNIGLSLVLGGILFKEATKTAENALTASINAIENNLDNIESLTQNYAVLAADHINDTSYLKTLSNELVKQNPHIYGSAIVLADDISHKNVFFAPYYYKDSTNTIKLERMEAQPNYWTSDWYSHPIQSGEASWSEPYFDEGGGNFWMTTYSYPIKNKHGKVIGLIFSDASLDWLKKETSKIQPYEHCITTIISKEGFFIATNEMFQGDCRYMMDAAQKTGNKKIIELTNLMQSGKTGSILFSQNGEHYNTVYGPFKNGWSMGITCGYTEIFADMYVLYETLLFDTILALLIIFFVCKKHIRQITQPLTEFSISAMNMAKGNFKARLPKIKSEDELLRLHNSLNYMQQTIGTYITELKTTTRNNERMESELNIARNIQLAMLPKDFPKTEHCNVHALMVPAKEVGGDLYDFIIINDYLYFSIGDVSGKGVPASLLMAIILSVQRFLYKFDFPMKKRIELINQSMSRNNDTGMFCTFFAARINLKTKKMEYCNAGHNAIIVIPPDPQEKPYFHNANANLALGLFGDFEYVDQTMDLAPGTRLVLYTDGVDEAETIKKEQFGDDRLLEVVSTNEFRQLDTEGMVNAIYTSVKDFTRNIEANDDITLLVVEI